MSDTTKCAATRDEAPCEITNTTGTPLCARCQNATLGHVLGEHVMFDYRGTRHAGIVTGFDVQTVKWSNQAGRRVPRAQPVGFATVQIEPAFEGRGSFSVSEFCRKLTVMRDVRVTFKNEDDIDGVPVGPVTIDDTAAADREARVAGPVGMPFGYKPPWRDTRDRWVSRDNALAIAAMFGVTLREW